MARSVFLSGLLSCLVCLNAFGNTEAPQTGVDSVCADFDIFIRYLEETHPDPYSAFGGRPLFYKEANRLRNSLVADSIATAEGLSSRLSRFISRLHDGHTFVNREFGATETPRFVAATFRHVGNDVTVRSILDYPKNLRGYRVISVEDVGIDKIKEKMAALFPAENESGILENVCLDLNNERILRELIDGFKNDSVRYSLLSPDGHTECVTLPLVTIDRIDQPRLRPASSLRLPEVNMGYAFLDDEGKTAYFRLSSIMSRDNISYMKDMGMEYMSQVERYLQFNRIDIPADTAEAISRLPVAAEVFGRLLSEMKERKSRNLIIDLRGNGGGWTPIVIPMLYQLYGAESLKANTGCAWYRKLSPLYIKKINTTLEDFNKANNSSLTFSDYIIESVPEFQIPADTTALNAIIRNEMMTLRPDLLMAQEGRAVYTPEKVCVVTDGRTFSAAFHLAFYLRKMGAVIAGTPSGQAPDCYMEVTGFTLPYTGVSGSISNSMQLFLPPSDSNARQLRPDIELSYEKLLEYSCDPNAEIMMVVDSL